jgi:hypothetical protein
VIGLLRVAAILAGLLLGGLHFGAVALAQPAPAPLPPTITLQEFQGVSCLVGGTAGALAAWTYAEVFITGTIVGSSLPILLPVVTTAFVAGCGVGSIISPGLLWVYRQF